MLPAVSVTFTTGAGGRVTDTAGGTTTTADVVRPVCLEMVADMLPETARVNSLVPSVSMEFC